MARPRNKVPEINQRSDNGNWYCWVPLPNGKRRKIEKKDRQAVKAELKVILADIAEGKDGSAAGKDLTWAEVIDAWIEAGCPAAGGLDRTYRNNRRRHAKKADINTVIEARRKLDTHVRPRIGNLKVNSTHPHQIEEMFQKLDQPGASKALGPDERLASSTIYVIYNKLDGAAAWAEYTRLTNHNPAEGILLPEKREPKRGGKSFPKEQLPTLLLAMARHPLAALWFLALTLGLRPGECRGIRWQYLDIDSKSPSVRIEAIPKEIDGKRTDQETNPKRDSKRLIELPPLTAAALIRHREEMAALGRYDPNGYAFLNRDGRCFLSGSLRQRFKGLCEKAELTDNWSPYDLRHTFATLQKITLDTLGSLPDAQEMMAGVQATMGHQHIGTTFGYVHDQDEAQRGHLAAWDLLQNGALPAVSKALSAISATFEQGLAIEAEATG